MGVSPWDDVSHTHTFMIQIRPWTLTSRTNLWAFVISVTSVSFDIGIPYLAHGSITMRGCVKYIHYPDTMLTFDLKVKFIEFVTWLCVHASDFLSFDTVILCLACKCITMVWCVAYIHELCMTLTPLTSISKLYFHHEFESGKMSLLLDIGIPNFGIWLYHQETSCYIHSWP